MTVFYSCFPLVFTILSTVDTELCVRLVRGEQNTAIKCSYVDAKVAPECYSFLNQVSKNL